jgi:hypothetical protein
MKAIGNLPAKCQEVFVLTLTSIADRGRLELGLAGKIVILFGLTLSSYGLFGLAPVLPAIAASFRDVPNADFLTRKMVSTLGIFVAIVSPLAAVAASVGRL